MDLFDFKRHRIDTAVTVAEMLEETGLTKLRFYIATKKDAERKIRTYFITNLLFRFFYYIFFQDCEDVTLISGSSENDHDGVLETDNESVHSIKSDNNDLTLQTLNPQELYNFVSLPPVTTNRRLYMYYAFRENL